MQQRERDLQLTHAEVNGYLHVSAALPSGKQNPVSLEQKAAWIQFPDGYYGGNKNLLPHKRSSQDSPFTYPITQSLYRLRYRGSSAICPSDESLFRFIGLSAVVIHEKQCIESQNKQERHELHTVYCARQFHVLVPLSPWH